MGDQWLPSAHDSKQLQSSPTRRQSDHEPLGRPTEADSERGGKSNSWFSTKTSMSLTTRRNEMESRLQKLLDKQNLAYVGGERGGKEALFSTLTTHRARFLTKAKPICVCVY